MKKRSLLLLIALFTISTGAFAQVKLMVEEGRHGPYLTNRFFDNIFISAGAGGLVYWGENDSHGSFGKRIAPAVDAAIGKWITPSVGMRLQYSGIQAKGWSSEFSRYAYGNPDNEGFFKEKFNLNYLHFDVLWNLSNAIGGYREDRFWDFVPYAGFGWVNANKKNRPTNNEFGFNAGLLNKMRLSPSFDLNLDIRIMFVNQGLDGVAYGSRAEYTTSASLGFAYKFARRHFRRPSDVISVDFSAYDARVNALERDLAASEARAAQLARDLAAANARQPETVVTTNVHVAQAAYFFEIGKAVLSQKEIVNLGFMADVIKKTPDKTYTLFGSADKQTGSHARNQQLSEMRVKAVYDVLVNKYGVNASQLKMNPVGDTQNRFPEPILNRVVIVEN